MDIDNRMVFDEQADLYDKIRPHYPDVLFDSLIDKTQLIENAHLLEIGPGTGQATLPLAQRGYTITAVELSKQMTRIARERLGAYSTVQIIISNFENLSLPPQAFDLIYAATAFHWLKPEFRYAKPHKLLHSAGHLAIIKTHHVSDEEGDLFFYSSKPLYDKYLPSKGSLNALPKPEDIKFSNDLDTSLFKLVNFECFPMTIDYNSVDYANLLATYSPQLSLPAVKRTAFLKEIKELIDKKFNGATTKHYIMSLTIAQKL